MSFLSSLKHSENKNIHIASWVKTWVDQDNLTPHKPPWNCTVIEKKIVGSTFVADWEQSSFMNVHDETFCRITETSLWFTDCR